MINVIRLTNVYIDSHCHLNLLDLAPYQGDLQKVLDQAHRVGVTHFLCVAITLDDHPTLVAIAEQYKNVFISAGLHPNENPDSALDSERLLQAARHDKVIAIGETGLDYYRQEQTSWQQQRFVQHIECARLCRKPLIIHTRAAREDTIRILREQSAQSIGGVIHCFTEDWQTARQALDLGFYISFSGIVTFKSAHEIQEVAKKVPLDRMLIETDAPYLAPVPHRGKPNVPAFVCHTAEYIAQLRNETVVEIAKKTTQNFFDLFQVT